MEISGKIIKITLFSEFPELAVSLKLPDNNWSPEIKLIVDTGYNGDVLLMSNMFEIWSGKMQRIPEDAEIGESVTGEVFTLQSVDSFLKLNDNHTFPIVISSHPAINENLIGWNILRHFVSVLQENQITIIDGK